MYNQHYSCFMCNVSFTTQFKLYKHLSTHIDDQTFHHSNINIKTGRKTRSSKRPSKYYKCNKCSKKLKNQLELNEHLLIHTGEKPHHCPVCDFKIRHISNFRRHIKSHKNVTTLTCFLCQNTIIGVNNYYTHYRDVHNKTPICNLQSSQISNSNIDKNVHPKVSNYKKKNLGLHDFPKDGEPFGPLFVKQEWRKKKLKLKNIIAEEKKNGQKVVQEEIKSSKQQLIKSIYYTEDHQKRLEALLLEKKSTGTINEVKKLIGPLFWKNALIKAGIRERDGFPTQFQSQLTLATCLSCRKCFARVPALNKGNVTPSNPPCAKCFSMKDEFILNKHKATCHSETPPFICKECFLESNTWFEYVQHMSIHLRHKTKCNECISHNRLCKTISSIAVFMCHICDKTFNSDEELQIHKPSHLEN